MPSANPATGRRLILGALNLILPCLLLMAGGIGTAFGTESLNTECASTVIGNGTGTWISPLRTSHHDARTQVIYLAGEMGGPGIIHSLALYVDTAPGHAMNNWTVRMKHTTLSSYTTPALEAGGWTVVYQNDELPGSTGWRVFEFQTPFHYNGTSNLMVDFSFNNDSSSTAGQCAMTVRAGVRCAYSYSYSLRDDPLDWSGTYAVYGSSNVPDLLLGVCPGGYVPEPPIAPSGFSHSEQSTSTITWVWVDNSSDETGFRGNDSANMERWFTADNMTSATEINLLPNTRYTRHVRAFNAGGLSLPSNSASVYTHIEDAWGIAFGTITTTSIAVKSSATHSNLTSGNSGLIIRNRTRGTNSGWKQNNDFWVSGSLTPNTSSSFSAQSRNGDGDLTTESNVTMKWTLPLPPAASSSYTATCPVGSTVVTFTNTVGFGPGLLSHLHYAWDRNPTYTFNNYEPSWNGGTLQLTANAKGAWYLHLSSHNGEHVSGGTIDILVNIEGPCIPPDYDLNGRVNQEDLDVFLSCVSGPAIPLPAECAFADLDGDGDLDQADFAIIQRCWSGELMVNPNCVN